MPPVVDSFDQLLLVAAGGVLWWLGGVLKTWFQNSTKKRREAVDREADLEHSVQEYREIVFTMRNMMLKSGHFDAEELPPLPIRKK